MDAGKMAGENSVSLSNNNNDNNNTNNQTQKTPSQHVRQRPDAPVSNAAKMNTGRSKCWIAAFQLITDTRNSLNFNLKLRKHRVLSQIKKETKTNFSIQVGRNRSALQIKIYIKIINPVRILFGNYPNTSAPLQDSYAAKKQTRFVHYFAKAVEHSEIKSWRFGLVKISSFISSSFGPQIKAIANSFLMAAPDEKSPKNTLNKRFIEKFL
uniref:Uncharacterized protein n=1 Tax=Glossina pallidipes TaxID=7398 RepID=A0A1B0A103_GLOPL